DRSHETPRGAAARTQGLRTKRARRRRTSARSGDWMAAWSCARAFVRSSAQAAVVQATDSHLRAELTESLVELLEVADLLEVHNEGGFDLVGGLVEAFQSGAGAGGGERGQDLAGAQVRGGRAGDGQVEVRGAGPAVKEAADRNQADNEDQGDDRDQGGAGAEAEAGTDGEEEEGEFFGFLNRGAKPHDGERADEAQRQGHGRTDDADDEGGGHGEHDEVPGKELAVGERLPEVNVGLAEQDA